MEISSAVIKRGQQRERRGVQLNFNDVFIHLVRCGQELVGLDNGQCKCVWRYASDGVKVTVLRKFNTSICFSLIIIRKFIVSDPMLNSAPSI